MDFDREKYDKFLIENNCLEFGNFTLSSGRKAYYYINFRSLMDNMESARKMVDFLYSFVNENVVSEEYTPCCFYGVPEGATSWGLWLTDKIDYLSSENINPMMGRGKPKSHGDPKDKNFIGNAQDEIDVVEDVTTTGGSLISELKRLKEAGFEVNNTIVFLDRCEISNGKTVKEKIEERGYNFLPLTSIDTLLKKGYEILQPEDEIVENIKDYLEEYCAVDLNL